MRNQWKEIIVALALGFGAVTLTHATLVMEWDFRTNQNLTVAGGTGSTNAFLLTNAVVNTGAAVPVPPANVDPIKTGYLSVPRAGQTDESGLITSNTAGEWRDYFGREAFGTGSVYIVFRPHFSGSNNLSGWPGRYWIFNYNDANNFDSLGLLLESDASGVGPAFTMGRSTFNQPTATLPNVNWDSNTWYLIGASWAVGEPTHIYLRELDTNKPSAQFASSSISLLEPNQPFLFNNRSFFVGRRQETNSTETADSDISLVRVFDNEFFTQAHFDSAYESLIIPEPIRSALLDIADGVGGLVRRWLR